MICINFIAFPWLHDCIHPSIHCARSERPLFAFIPLAQEPNRRRKASNERRTASARGELVREGKTAALEHSRQRTFLFGNVLFKSNFLLTSRLDADSAFTERILGMPSENYKGYVEADATERASHIPSNSLFLLHGLADLTTPHIHGIRLARSLTDAGKLFQYQVRPRCAPPPN